MTHKCYCTTVLLCAKRHDSLEMQRNQRDITVFTPCA